MLAKIYKDNWMELLNLKIQIKFWESLHWLVEKWEPFSHARSCFPCSLHTCLSFLLSLTSHLSWLKI